MRTIDGISKRQLVQSTQHRHQSKMESKSNGDERVNFKGNKIS